MSTPTLVIIMVSTILIAIVAAGLIAEYRDAKRRPSK